MRRIWKGTWDMHAVTSPIVGDAAHVRTDCGLLVHTDQTGLVDATDRTAVTCPECMLEPERPVPSDARSDQNHMVDNRSEPGRKLMTVNGTPDVVTFELRLPVWLIEAAGAKFPDDTTSELLRRGLATLAGVDPPGVRMGRHE